MWKQVFAPTLLVVVIWVVFSGLTSLYIQWQDHTQSRLLVENVSSIRVASTMQEYVWQMEAIAFDTGIAAETRHARLKNLEQSFRTSLQAARTTAMAPGEPELIDRISQRFDQYCQRVHRRVTGLRPSPDTLKAAVYSVDTVVEPCQKLMELNQELLREATRDRERLSAVVVFGRTTVLIVGPALGIWLGLRISRRLHRSITEISITLRDAAGALDREIGRVSLPANVDFPDLQRQVQAVGARIRQVLEELQIARQEVLRTERLAAVGELAAGVAHELRNPMTSVKLLLQSAIQRNRSRPDRQFQIILDELARMETTIQGLLDFARPPRIRRVPHDLRQTVRRALNLVEGRAKHQAVKLDASLCDLPLEVDGDPEQLHQVFINLLLNALEAMPDGGVLSVESTSLPSGLAARVSFADTGVGLSSDLIPRMFEPFATTKERGTGLGLAISRRIIDDHGGRLWGENQPHGGAIFSVELPLKSTTERLAAPSPTLRNESLRVETLAASA